MDEEVLGDVLYPPPRFCGQTRTHPRDEDDHDGGPEKTKNPGSFGGGPDGCWTGVEAGKGRGRELATTGGT
jgi:hypothetical protein